MRARARKGSALFRSGIRPRAKLNETVTLQVGEIGCGLWEPGKLIDLPLALESEWELKFDKILEDFEKLVVSRALLRVMIFETSLNTGEQHFNRLIEAIRCYSGTQRGDQYLLACWCCGSPPGHLEFKTYIVE